MAFEDVIAFLGAGFVPKPQDVYAEAQRIAGDMKPIEWVRHFRMEIPQDYAHTRLTPEIAEPFATSIGDLLRANRSAPSWEAPYKAAAYDLDGGRVLWIVLSGHAFSGAWWATDLKHHDRNLSSTPPRQPGSPSQPSNARRRKLDRDIAGRTFSDACDSHPIAFGTPRAVGPPGTVSLDPSFVAESRLRQKIVRAKLQASGTAKGLSRAEKQNAVRLLAVSHTNYEPWYVCEKCAKEVFRMSPADLKAAQFGPYLSAGSPVSVLVGTDFLPSFADLVAARWSDLVDETTSLIPWSLPRVGLPGPPNHLGRAMEDALHEVGCRSGKTPKPPPQQTGFTVARTMNRQRWIAVAPVVPRRPPRGPWPWQWIRGQ